MSCVACGLWGARYRCADGCELCRPEVSEYEVKRLPHGKLAVIESVSGHIAGTGADDVDKAWIDRQIAKF